MKPSTLAALLCACALVQGCASASPGATQPTGALIPVTPRSAALAAQWVGEPVGRVVPAMDTPRQHFGSAVAFEGDTLVVGSNYAHLGPLAWAFARVGDAWTEQARWTEPPSHNGDFGTAVALSGDSALVGASGRDNQPGAAFVYVRSGTGWTLQGQLAPDSGRRSSSFGVAVALRGDTAVVGNNDDAAAYVFTRTAGVWARTAQLRASDGAPDDGFGYSVAMSDNTIVVGAGNRGKVYVFEREGGAWTQRALLRAEAPAPDDVFGDALALDGETLLVGASGRSVMPGAAYLFARSAGAWTQRAVLRGEGVVAGQDFGRTLALRGDTAVVGSLGVEHGAGAGFVFVRGAGGWTQHAVLRAEEPGPQRYLGCAVGISGNTIVLGASGASAQRGRVFEYRRGGAR